MTSAAEFQAKVTKGAANMDRWDQIVNGGPAATVATDNGTIPSIANALQNLLGTDKVFTLSDTVTLLQAIVPTPLQPHLALVTKDLTPANNGFWQYPKAGGGPWVIATTLNAALKGATGEAGTMSAAALADLQAAVLDTLSVTPKGLGLLGLAPVAQTSGTYPASDGGASLAIGLTVFGADQVKAEGQLQGLSVYSASAGPATLVVCSDNGDGTVTIQNSQAVTLVSGANSFANWTPYVGAGWWVGVFFSGAIRYLGGQAGKTLTYTTGLPATSTTKGTTGNAVPSVFYKVLAGEVARARANEAGLQGQFNGSTVIGGTYPATQLSANALAAAYTAISEADLSSGRLASVSVWMSAAGSGYLYLLNRSGTTFTAAAAKKVTWVAGLNTISWPITTTAGQRLGAYNPATNAYYAAATGSTAYYFAGQPSAGGNTGSLLSNQKFSIGFQVVSGVNPRLAAAETSITANDPTLAGYGLLSTADVTGGADATAVFAAARAAHDNPYVPAGNYWVTTLPYGGDGFWGPGKIYVGASFATGVRHLIPARQMSQGLLLRLRAKLARLIGSGSPLVYITDSLGEGEFYPSSLARHWGNQIEDFANWAYAPGSEPGCVILRTRTAGGGDGGCNAAWFGLTVSGTTGGTAGPVGKSAILAAGDSISFTGAYASVDVFYQQATGAGSLTFAYNGTTYKTVNAAGAAANDVYSGTISRSGTTAAGSRTITGLSATADLEVGAQISSANFPAGSTITTIDSASQITISSFANASGSATLTILTPSLTGQTASGTYTITATGGAVELTGLLRRAARTSATSARGLRVHRVGYGGYATSTYTNALVDSIIAQSLALGPSPRYLIELGTNDWLFGGDTAVQSGVLNTTDVITGLSPYGLRVGDPVAASGIPAGAYVSAILSATSVQISTAATTSGNASVTFSVGRQRSMLVNAYRVITRLQTQGQAESVWWVSPTRANPASGSVSPFVTEGDFDTYIGLIDQVCQATGAKHIAMSDKDAQGLGWLYTDGIHWIDAEQDYVADRLVGEMA